MNINTFLEDTQSFLNNVILQLSTHNSINCDDLKLICFIEYNQRSQVNNEIIAELLTTIFGLIKEDTVIYSLTSLSTENDIATFNTYINPRIREDNI